MKSHGGFLSEKAIFFFLASSLLIVGCGKTFKPVPSGASLASIQAPGSPPSPSQPGGSPGNGGAPNQPPAPPNAFVFKKSPAAQGASQLYSVSGYAVEPSTPLNFDRFLVEAHVDPSPSGFLENSNFVVLRQKGETSTGRARADQDGKWKFSSANDPQHFLGQLLTYYWLELTKDTLNSSLKDSLYIKNKRIPVYTYCLNQQNAYWSGYDTQFMCLGYVGPMEMSFDGSVTVHEMGHGNLAFATQGDAESYANEGGCMAGRCCASSAGCSAAINEGQADVHSQMVFGSGVIGEFAFSSPDGIPGRNAEKFSGLTAQAMFNGTAIDPSSGQPVGQMGPEIHYMGSVWAAAWWSLRKELGPEKTNPIFLKHLPYLSGEDTFRTALTTVLQADKDLFASANKSKILSVFSKHGITPQ